MKRSAFKGSASVKHQKGRRSTNDVEEGMVAAIQEKELWEAFKRDIAPKLREALQAGVKGDDLYRQFSDLAAARAITIALTEKDSGKALSAVREILDRTQGKAVERKEFKHKLQELSDEQLDALILSEVEQDEAAEDTAQKPN